MDTKEEKLHINNNYLGQEEIKQAFIDSNLPVGHWGTWVKAIEWALSMAGD